MIHKIQIQNFVNVEILETRNSRNAEYLFLFLSFFKRIFNSILLKIKIIINFDF